MVEMRRSRDGDKENDNGRDPARNDLLSLLVYVDHLIEDTDAIAITVLKVSSIKRPSNILTSLKGYGPANCSTLRQPISDQRHDVRSI